uniref:Retrovirus-related Pol polyprotein from transposon TNT 1-94 n=1 Tax=Tanacetum cinerariifolium TaxID=118510 RepID=A0A699KPG7_TANCI|nr:retrovirus-related Pol polyprotein from transposon TNT 1-94 [Tanacetum cinerariifolium]
MMSEDSSAAGTDNRPPILEESDYESWKIRIERYIKGKTHGKLIWKSILNGPSAHPQITNPVPTGSPAVIVMQPKDKRDEEFTDAENLKELCDIQASNILCQGSGQTLDRRKEDLFDEYERFRANGNELIQDYFVPFYKLINDVKIANLLSGFQKHIPPTNNQLRSSSNTRTHATMHDGQITTESVQRRAPGNNGNTRYRGNQDNGQGVNNKKKVICYNFCGEGHVARQCKEPKHPKDSLWHQDKVMLLQAKENGAVLDAEAEAFLANVECTVPLAEPFALTTTNMLQVNHEDDYDSDVDDEPNAAAAFMANLSSSSSQINKGSRTTNLYSISLNDMLSASLVCLLTKASSTKSWLWHRRLNHLNFGTLNELARNDLVRGLPLLKYDKDHLYPSCQLGKSKKASHPLKTENSQFSTYGPLRTNAN